ncbi:cation:proton antiporter [Thomasclavelia sp.]
MLLSISLILLVGMFAGWICTRLHLPSLLGMILTGMILGPFTLNLIDDSILNISSELRKIALIIILTRAGLALNFKDLKKVGRPAILMCFVPACFEILGIIILAPKLLGISIIDAAIMGAVIAAVSPAIIVPKMLKMMEEGYGVNKGIPQLILAGASVDDVFVIVLFFAFTNLAQEGTISLLNFIQIPISIFLGIIIGVLIGYILIKYFSIIHIRDSIKVMIIICISFILVTIEDNFSLSIPFSSLISIMCIGIIIQRKKQILANRLSLKFNKLWIGAEIMLFVLVGATVDLRYVLESSVFVIILILGGVIFRASGVFCCLLKTKLELKERLFCIMAYMPKATVQAAIGSLPLAMGLSCGKIVLTVAVLSILITAPIGAFLIDISYKVLTDNK